MEEEIKELKSERKIEKREIKQDNSKKKGIIAGVVAGGAVALALGLGLGLGLKSTPMYEVQLESNIQDDTLTGDGEFKKGSIVTIEAEPIDGYKFTHWNFNGQAITANPYIFELNEDTRGIYEAVYEEILPVVTVSIDGLTTNKEVEKGIKLSEFLATEFSDITDYNSCGWFISDTFGESVDLTQEITGNISLYTKKATLDKLSFVLNDDEESYSVSMIDDTISGEVVIPRYYVEGEIGFPVTKIAENAFNNSSELDGLIMSNTIEYIDLYAFCDSTIEYITIPDSLLSIGEASFAGCLNLKSINLSKNLNFIDLGAFENTGLKTLTIPASVEEMGECVFQSNQYLESVYFEDYGKLQRIEVDTFNGCTNLKYVKLSNTLKELCDYAFYYCSSLTSIEISSSVNRIGSSVFGGCTTLETIEVTSDNINYSSEDGVLYNTDKTSLIMYPAGKKETNFEMPNTIISIETFAFSTCINLVNLTLSSSLKTIGSGAFYDCDKVINITIPSSVETICDNAFSSCDKLSSVKFENNIKLKTIGAKAFQKCKVLNEIIIPETIETIDFDAFSNCANLTIVTIESIYAYTTANSLSSCGDILGNATTIHVIASIVDDVNNTNTFLNDSSKYTKSEKVTIEGKVYYTYTKI